MPSSDIRRVVASESKDEIVTLNSGPLRIANSNEAVVRIKTISLNRGELRRAQSASDGQMQIGWDFAGIVETPSADGSGPPSGTRVVGFSPRMEGWAEQIAIATDYIAPIPENVTDAQAATMPVAGLTALHAVDAGNCILGRKALITGASGGVGMFAIQLAALAGALPYAQIRHSNHKVFIKKLGDFESIVTVDGETLGKYGQYRLIIDGVSGSILKTAIGALGPDGICVCYGVTDTPEVPIDIGMFMRIGLAQIMGFHLYAKSETSPPSENLPRLLALIANGSLNCVIERETSWEEIDRVAKELIDRRFLGKAVLHIN